MIEADVLYCTMDQKKIATKPARGWLTKRHKLFETLMYFLKQV